MTTDAPMVVVDTTVHLSSEIFSRPGSPAKETLARGFDGHFAFALSPALLREIARKMVECGVPGDDVAEYLADLRVAGQLFDDEDAGDLTCADPDDLFVLVLAPVPLAHESDEGLTLRGRGSMLAW